VSSETVKILHSLGYSPINPFTGRSSGVPQAPGGAGGKLNLIYRVYSIIKT